MKMDILVILMMAFGLFAILMFILFYIYAKKHYNDKQMNDELALIDDDNEEVNSSLEKDKEEPIIEEISDEKNITEIDSNKKEDIIEINSAQSDFDPESDFVPKKKKD